MAVGEDDPFTREPIEVGRGEFRLRVERAHVAVALVVGVDDDDVGPGLFCGVGRGERGAQQCEPKREGVFHGSGFGGRTSTLGPEETLRG